MTKRSFVIDVLDLSGKCTIKVSDILLSASKRIAGVLNANTRKAFKWFIKSRRSSNNAKKNNLSRPTQALSEIPEKELIGQPRVKRKLEHYFSGLKNPKTCQSFLLFVGAKGLGKTEFARQFSKKITNKGSCRSFMEIPAVTIKNLDCFFDRVYIPYIENKEITMFFDEAHNLPDDLSNLFCTIFNNERRHTRKFQGGDGKHFSFNFMMQTFLFATTEPDKLYDPFKERLTQVDFANYSAPELAKMIEDECETIFFEGDVSLTLAKKSRGNARHAVKLAKDIQIYLNTISENVFKQDHIDDFCDVFEVYPLGLESSELRYLKILNHGPASLTDLSAKTDRSRPALQYETERFLVKNDLMEIDAKHKRRITDIGRQYLHNLAGDTNYEVPPPR